MAATNLTPIDWAKRPIENYAKFEGRAPRAEYWWYVLAIIVATIVAIVIDGLIGIKLAGPYGPLYLLLALGTLVPSITVTVRRLHDTNRSGWWTLLVVPYAVAALLAMRAMASASMVGLGSAGLLAIIGLVCLIALLVFMVLPSTPGDNRYGPNPYGEGAAPAAAA